MKLFLLITMLLALTLQQDKMDLRTNKKYEGCASLREVHFEGVCSSSWAITVAAVASDVKCASSTSTPKDSTKRISYQNIMECCSDCYIGYENGCFGGNFVKAGQFLSSTGAVTGTSLAGPLASDFCKNYKLKECYQDPKKSPACTDADFNYAAAVDTCDKKCSNAQKEYEKEIIKFKQFKEVEKGQSSSYASAMEAQISALNILITEMTVFEDLYSYRKEEVYVHLYGRSVGSLTVAIYGFDTDSNTNQGYWIVKLPWGKEFGDQGFIKVQRGTNNSGIENSGNVYYLLSD